MAIFFLFSFAYAYVCKMVKWYDPIRALLHKLLIFATSSFNIVTNKLREIMFMLSFCSHVGDFFYSKDVQSITEKHPMFTESHGETRKAHQKMHKKHLCAKRYEFQKR